MLGCSWDEPLPDPGPDKSRRVSRESFVVRPAAAESEGLAGGARSCVHETVFQLGVS